MSYRPPIRLDWDRVLRALCAIQDQREDCDSAAGMANVLAMTPLLGAKCATASRPSAFGGKAHRTARVQVLAQPSNFHSVLL